MYFQFEFIRIVHRTERLFFVDDAILEEGIYGLIEGLGPIDGMVSRHQVRDFIGTLRIENAVGDHARIPHNFDRSDSAAKFGSNESLRQCGSQDAGELHSNLLVMMGRKEPDDPVDCFGGVNRMECAQHEVPGFGCIECNLYSFPVSEFPYKNCIGVLA